MADTKLEMRSLFFEDLTLGLSESMSHTITDADIRGFAQLSGDSNPIHLSEEFAAKTFLKTRIAHGIFTASFISALIGMRLPGPGAIYISQTLFFKAPVRLGDTVKVKVEVVELMVEKCRARLACSCMVGDEVVLEGEAWVKVPSKLPRPEKAA
jgi:3-hydroxybutyryl-CoA dehydratase